MNNAGVDASGDDVADLSTETFDRAMKINVYGTFFCCRRYVQLRKSGAATGGKIINVTSVHQEIPNAGGADYDCSKGALRMLSRRSPWSSLRCRSTSTASARGWS